MSETDAFAAQDELAEWAVQNATALAEIDRKHARTDAELERDTGEPHIDGWPLYSGLPPAAAQTTTEAA